MMSESENDRLYLEWLYTQIESGEVKESGRSYRTLSRLLLTKQFEAFVGNDDNRIADGLDLRLEFQRLYLPSGPDIWVRMPATASVLEILVALSRRVSFETGEGAVGWAWELLKNLDLHHISDPVNKVEAKLVDRILTQLIKRTYRPNGDGGFFPLINAREDQREVEIWYQMNAYISEIQRV